MIVTGVATIGLPFSVQRGVSLARIYVAPRSPQALTFDDVGA
jgi:hypothetical protein